MTAGIDGLRVVTVATERRDPNKNKGGHIQVLEDSCRALGLELAVLGVGRAWQSTATKLVFFAEFLADLPDDTVCLFVDAYDVVLLPSCVHLVERFHSFRRGIVFSAETNCWPHPELSSAYPQAPRLRPHQDAARTVRPPPPLKTPFRYLNSGSYVGYAGEIRRVIEDLSPRGDERDQGLYTRYFLKHPDKIALDYGARLFQTLVGVESSDLVFDGGEPWTLRNRYLGTDPCVLHGNGGGMVPFVDLLRRLRARGWPKRHDR